MALPDEMPAKVKTNSLIFLSIPLEAVPGGQAVFAYSNAETASREPDNLNKCEVPFRAVFNMMYTVSVFCAIFINYNIDDKFVVIARDEFVKLLTPFVHKQLRKTQTQVEKNMRGRFEFMPPLN